MSKTLGPVLSWPAIFVACTIGPLHFYISLIFLLYECEIRLRCTYCNTICQNHMQTRRGCMGRMAKRWNEALFLKMTSYLINTDQGVKKFNTRQIAYMLHTYNSWQDGLEMSSEVFVLKRCLGSYCTRLKCLQRSTVNNRNKCTFLTKHERFVL